MKKVIGWLLFAWGTLGILTNIVDVLFIGALSISILIGNSVLCILLIWVGIRLASSTKKNNNQVKQAIEGYLVSCPSCNAAIRTLDKFYQCPICSKMFVRG